MCAVTRRKVLTMAREGIGEVAGGGSAGLGMVEVMASTAEGLGDAPTRDWRLCRCYAKLALVQEDENHMCIPECNGILPVQCMRPAVVQSALISSRGSKFWANGPP